MMSSKLILLEFNELTPDLMDRFIDEGHLPNFKHLRDQSECYVSDAGEEPPALEPWIQWVSVHTGQSYAEHGVFDLGDGEELKTPRLWDKVAEAGGTALVFSSMNACFNEKWHGRINLVPDPWSIDLRPSPAGLYDDFYNFIRAYVHEYTSSRPPIAFSDYGRFIRFMIKTGLSVTTIRDTVQQLLSERKGAPKWRRAAILDRLIWDVFRREWIRLKPDIATVFLNSTAHLQHYYWRDMEPEKFHLKPDPMAKAHDAILFGYQRMDRIVGECLSMVGSFANIALCSALGQQPLTKYEQGGGKLIFKLRDASVLLRFAGFRGEFKYSPVMAEQFHLIFQNSEQAALAHEALEKMRIVDTPLMDLRIEGNVVFGGCGLIRDPGDDALVTTPNSNHHLPFNALFYPVDALKSGMHHPDGIFWISGLGIQPVRHVRKIPITEISNRLLAAVGVSDQFRKPERVQSA